MASEDDIGRRCPISEGVADRGYIDLLQRHPGLVVGIAEFNRIYQQPLLSLNKRIISSGAHRTVVCLPDAGVVIKSPKEQFGESARVCRYGLRLECEALLRLHEHYGNTPYADRMPKVATIGVGAEGDIEKIAVRYIVGQNWGELTPYERRRWYFRLGTNLSLYHPAGVYLTDIKPADVIQTSDGPVIVDFGQPFIFPAEIDQNFFDSIDGSLAFLQSALFATDLFNSVRRLPVLHKLAFARFSSLDELLAAEVVNNTTWERHRRGLSGITTSVSKAKNQDSVNRRRRYEADFKSDASELERAQQVIATAGELAAVDTTFREIRELAGNIDLESGVADQFAAWHRVMAGLADLQGKYGHIRSDDIIPPEVQETYRTIASGFRQQCLTVRRFLEACHYRDMGSRILANLAGKVDSPLLADIIRASGRPPSKQSECGEYVRILTGNMGTYRQQMEVMREELSKADVEQALGCLEYTLT